jgi:hypothetical protein
LSYLQVDQAMSPGIQVCSLAAGTIKLPFRELKSNLMERRARDVGAANRRDARAQAARGPHPQAA